jgi:elongation factor 2
MTVIAHVDHGKTTLTDLLVAKSGLLSDSRAGTALKTDTLKLEQERGISIKATSISLYHETEIEEKKGEESVKVSAPHIIHLIDSPGHIEFSSEVTASLRVTDGALVVVDYIEGVCIQTEMVLRQALAEKVRPVLLINKMDKGIGNEHEPEQFYHQCQKIINEVNFIISEFIPEEEYKIDPCTGNVAFGSGYFGWAFTIKDMAKKYAAKFKTDPELLVQKLWGEHFYDGKKFTSKADDVDIEKDRGFNKFIISPLIRLQQSITKQDYETTKKILKKIDIELKDKDWEEHHTDLLKIVFKKWINAAESILDMCCEHLPSPKEAQKYRTAVLFSGTKSSERKQSSEESDKDEEEDKVAEGEESEEETKGCIDDDLAIEAMEKCDPEGPTMIFISKLFPVGQNIVAFGRIFSGTVKAGEKVKVYSAESKKPQIQIVKKVAICMGKDIESIGEMPCGNTLVLGGVDTAIRKEGTIMSETLNANRFKAMKFSVSPVVEVAVKCAKPTDQPKLVNALKKLTQTESCLRVETKESGETVIAGSGALHIEICIHNLREYSNIEIECSEPTVSYRETVIGECEPVLAKSSNKHNRLWISSEQIEAGLCTEIEENNLLSNKTHHIHKVLKEKFGYDANDCRKLWSFGLGDAEANCIGDKTSSVQHMKEIKGNVLSAFNGLILNGPLTDEKLRQVKFSITDARIHSDAVHRGGSQIVPAATRAMKGAMLSSKPRLQEPILLCTVKVMESLRGDVYSALGNKRGKIISDEYDNESTIIIKAHLPVAESFGFAEYLRDETSGRAMPQFAFSHWETINSDPFEEGSMANELVKQIRARKGLSAEVPQPEAFIDKL